MGVNSLPKTVTRQRRGCDLNPGRSAPESSTLTTRLSSHLSGHKVDYFRAFFPPKNYISRTKPKRMKVPVQTDLLLVIWFVGVLRSSIDYINLPLFTFTYLLICGPITVCSTMPYRTFCMKISKTSYRVCW